MFEDENLSVETEEVAEPLEEQTEDLSEENQNVADSDSQGEDTENGKTSQDSAFAEMRRARAEAERQAQEAREELESLKAEQEARQKALSKLSGGRENAELEALAESLGIDVEDVIQTLEAETSQARVETERRLDSALNELEKLDSKLTEDDISNVLMYVDKGLSTEDAYYAVKAKEINTKAIPPKPIGKLNQSKPIEKDFYTEAEVDAMTPQQQRANYKVIMRSMSKW